MQREGKKPTLYFVVQNYLYNEIYLIMKSIAIKPGSSGDDQKDPTTSAEDQVIGWPPPPHINNYRCLSQSFNFWSPSSTLTFLLQLKSSCFHVGQKGSMPAQTLPSKCALCSCYTDNRICNPSLKYHQSLNLCTLERLMISCVWIRFCLVKQARQILLLSNRLVLKSILWGSFSLAV